MNETTMMIITTIFSLIGILVTRIAIPYIQEKLSNEQLKSLQTWVHIAVYGAEQLYKQKNEGKKKKEYVVNFIKEKFPQVTDKQIDILIESAVKALNIDMSILES